MPLYEYQCEACGQRFEVIRKFSDPNLDTCVRCGGGPVQRLPSSPAIQFKGTGWYLTDYSQKGKAGAESKAGTDGKSSEGASAPNRDAKSEPAAESSPSTGEAPPPKTKPASDT